jgi:hypothetical protein
MRLKGALVVAMLLTTTVNATAADYAPAYHRIRAGLQRKPVASRLVVKHLPAAAVRRPQNQTRNRPSLWRGAAIGAGVGAAIGGLLWAPSLCGSNDSECTAITVPVGLAAGAGIGAAAGAIVQALAR